MVVLSQCQTSNYPVRGTRFVGRPSSHSSSTEVPTVIFSLHNVSDFPPFHGASSQQAVPGVLFCYHFFGSSPPASLPSNFVVDSLFCRECVFSFCPFPPDCLLPKHGPKPTVLTRLTPQQGWGTDSNAVFWTFYCKALPPKNQGMMINHDTRHDINTTSCAFSSSIVVVSLFSDSPTEQTLTPKINHKPKTIITFQPKILPRTDQQQNEKKNPFAIGTRTRM